MSANRIVNTVVAGLAVLGVAAFAANCHAALIQGNIYIDTEYVSGGAAGSSQHTVNVTAADDNIVLDVYAVVADATANLSTDNYLQLSANFATSGSTAPNSLYGNVSWGSWNTGPTNPINTATAQSYTGYNTAPTAWAPQAALGALGLGGSGYSVDTTAVHWYQPEVNAGSQLSTLFVDSNGQPTTQATASGVEWLLGTIDVSFSNSIGSVNVSQTDSLAIGTWFGKSPSTKPYAFKSSTNTGGGGVFGSSTIVGNQPSGATNSLVYSPMAFAFTAIAGSGTNTLSPAAAITTAGSPPSGLPTGLNGASLGLSATLTNTPFNSGANTISWNYLSSTNGAASLSPTSNSGLASGSPQTTVGSLTLPASTANAFFAQTSVLTFTGTDSQNNITTPNPMASVTYNLIGFGDKNGVADGSGTPGGSYGNVMMTGSVGGSVAGAETTLGTSTSFGIGSTYAEILAGSMTNSSGLTMKWRSRASTELPGANPLGNLALYSDVVNLGGITGGSASSYALQMSYDPGQVTSGEASAASNGYLFIGWRNPGTGVWTNAVNHNDSTGSLVVASSDTNFQGSWSAFTAAAGVTPGNLAQFLGSWGVDTANHDVWSVLDAGGELAVVPEPGTLALLAAGLVSLGVAYRRRKAAVVA